MKDNVTKEKYYFLCCLYWVWNSVITSRKNNKFVGEQINGENFVGARERKQRENWVFYNCIL